MGISPIGLIVVSHGFYCEELIRTIHMIYGPVDDLIALPLREGQEPDDYCAQLHQLISQYNGNVLFLIDLMGGTPFNSVMKQGIHWPLAAVAGVNIPMVLEAITMREDVESPLHLAKLIAKNTLESIIDITPQLSVYYEKYASTRE